MKLISVQSRGNRLVIIERFELFGTDYVLTRKKLSGKKFKLYGRLRAFEIRRSALKAAEEWLKGASE